MPTKVLFRKWKQTDDPILSQFTGDISALFPYECDSYDDADECKCYDHVGQHGQADYEYVLSLTVPAKPEEYKELHDELVNLLGYEDLEVLVRAPNKHTAWSVRATKIRNYRKGE